MKEEKKEEEKKEEEKGKEKNECNPYVNFHNLIMRR